MPKGFLPNSDAKLLTWATNFANHINEPGADLGLTLEQRETFQADRDSYANAYRVATDIATRTRGAVLAKNTARQTLRISARALAAIVQAHPPVTDQQRIELGLTVRSKKPTRIGRPEAAPILKIRSVSGHRLRVWLRDSESLFSGRKPANVIGATVLFCISEEDPSALHTWQFQKNTTKLRFDVRLPSHLPPGAKVWLAAWWLNAKLQRGPASKPVSTHIQHGPVVPLALAA
jgi:hypothetical protein